MCSPRVCNLLSLPDDLLAVSISFVSASTLIRASAACTDLRRLATTEARERCVLTMRPYDSRLEPEPGVDDEEAFDEWDDLSLHEQVTRKPLVVAFRSELFTLLCQVSRREWQDSGGFLCFRLTPIRRIVAWDEDTALIHNGFGLQWLHDKPRAGASREFDYVAGL